QSTCYATMEKYADHHKISLIDLKLERDIFLVFSCLYIISKYILLLSITFGIKKKSVIKINNNVCKMLIFLICFILLKQPGVKLTPKNTDAYSMRTGHCKHVIMFILCLHSCPH